MLEPLLLIGVIALAVLAYQLYGIRQRLDTDAQRAETLRLEQELDAEIRESCPNLFYRFRTDLREWFRLHERRRQHYEEHKSVANAVDPHSDEEASWYDVFTRLLRDANDERKLTLGALASTTDTFLQHAREETVLTAAEISFLAHSAWHDLLNEPCSDPVLTIVGDHLKERLNNYVEEYRRVDAAQTAG